MEFCSATLQAQPSCSFPVRTSIITSKTPSFSSTVTYSPVFSSRFNGCRFSINPLRRRHRWLSPTLAAAAAVSGEELSVSDSSSINDESGRNGEEEDGGVEVLDDNKMVRVCDKLIDVFLVDKPTPTDWRRLLAFSKEWDNIRPHFYKRHNELLEVIRGSPLEISEVVARRRKDFTKEFFVHLHTVAESYYDNPTEQNALAKLGNTCLAAVQACDSATESIEALHAAELKFQDIINSPTIDAACRKIDNLAEKNELDSTLVMMITKAWSAAKESNMTKDEVKDVLYHLYVTARGNLQRLMPKEIRIVKYLLSIEDPDERLCALNDAFTPGEELEGKDVDCLYTTPEKLHNWIKTVVDAYHFSREGTLIREARDLMNPKIIEKMEVIMKIVKDKFM
ncbi:uncharacterized protein CFP56_001817 [Quercus suber]|uniref:Uncharacterized protein n=1 Tax=Quercus suber TaxID=58331 RepID=A0AAW0LHQ8_QUESU